MLFGLQFKIVFGYKETTDYDDSPIKSFLSLFLITPEVSYLLFYLLPFPLFWWLMYKYVRNYTFEPYSCSSLFKWALSVSTRSKNEVEDRFDDYAERRAREIWGEGGKVPKQWKVILKSFCYSLIFAAYIPSLYLVPAGQFIDGMMVKESKVLRTVVTGKYTYKLRRSSRVYEVKCSIDMERVVLRVDEDTYEDVRVGDTIMLSVRYGSLDYNIDDYKIFTKADRDHELNKKIEAEVAAKLAAEAAPKPKTEKDLMMDKGTAQLAQYIKKNLFDVVETTNGTVTVIFRVDKEGRISNVEMQKKLHRRVDKALLEAIKDLKEWPAVKILELKKSAMVNLHVLYKQGKPSVMECTIIPSTGVVTYRSNVKY